MNAEIDVTLLREWNAINKNAGKGCNSRDDVCKIRRENDEVQIPIPHQPCDSLLVPSRR